MSTDLLRLRQPVLSQYRDLLLLRSEGSIAVDVLGWIEGHGFDGKTCLVMPEGSLAGSWTPVPLDTVARALDAAGEDDPGVYPLINDDFPDHLIRAALFEGSAPDGYSAEQMKDLRRVLDLYVPKPARDTLRLFGLADISSSVMDRVTVLSQGDPEARRQAILSFPLSRHLILMSSEAREIVDARAPLLPWIGATRDLDAAALRRYSMIETRIGDALRGPDGQMALAELRAARVDNSDLPVQAAKLLSLAQIPEDFSGTIAMLKAVRIANEITGRIQMGFAPFARLLRRVKAGEWSEVAPTLEREIRPQECKDYLNAAAKVVATGLLVQELRSDPGIDLPRLARTAELLWQKQPVPKEEGVYLSRFLDGLEKMRWQVMNGLETSIRTSISEAMSLKDLRELQTRWHHVRTTLDNKVLATSEPVSWTPLLGRIDLGKGVTGRELASSTDLETQGDRERHCVGGYASVVLAGRRGGASVIFSIEKEDLVLSTVEVKVSVEEVSRRNSRVEANVVQNKAARNAQPSALAQSAGTRLATLIGAMPIEEVKTYLKGVESNGATIKDRLDRTIIAYGANITHPGLAELGLGTYREVMPKGLRDASIEDWADRLTTARPEALVPLRSQVASIVKNLAELTPKAEPELAAAEPLSL